MTLYVKWVFLYRALDIQHFARIPKRFLFSILHVGLVISKYIDLVAENVKKSETGALKDSWQNEPLLTF